MKKTIDLPNIKGEIEIEDDVLHSKIIKEFFSRPDIKNAIDTNNLDYVYEKWALDHEQTISTSNTAALTGILLVADIDVLDWLTEIPARVFCNYDTLTSIMPTSIIIPEGVTKIGRDAFYGCKSLKSIIIPEGIIEMGYWAFCDCKSLESITIPSSITKISNGAFSCCESLTSITIPNSITEIGGWTFNGCTSLKSMTIPDRVTKIGGYAFDRCNNLKTIYCKAKSKPIGWDEDWLGDCEAKIIWGA